MIHKISNEKLTVEISSKGGEIYSIRDAEGKEYLWQGDKEVWEDRAPNLFPYIGRMTDKKYQFAGSVYPMEIHGFLPSSKMQMVSKEEDTLVLKLASSEETQAQYPFLFALFIRYHLNGAALEITYQVENHDQKTMYFGIGGHPGFQVPLEEGLSFEDYRIDFGAGAAPYRQRMSEDCFVLDGEDAFVLEEGRFLNLTHDLFDDDAIILKSMPKTAVLGSPKGKKEIVVSYGQMDYLGIWHRPFKQPGYVCIEPWSSLPSRKGVVEDLAMQPGLIALPAGERYENIWSIEIRDVQ